MYSHYHFSVENKVWKGVKRGVCLLIGFLVKEALVAIIAVIIKIKIKNGNVNN